MNGLCGAPFLSRWYSNGAKKSGTIEMLIGFELIDQTSQTKHEIIEVYPIVNNPLLEVKTKNNTTILVPYQKEFIVKIDIKNKTLICKLPEGLV